MLIETATEISGAADPSVPAARSRQGQGGGVLGAEERSGRPQRRACAAAEEAELAEEPEFSSGDGDGLAEQPQRGRRRRRLHRALRAGGGGGGGPQDREAVAAVGLGVEVARLSQPEVAVKIRRLP